MKNRILVIDDDKDFLENTKNFLRGEGYSVVSTTEILKAVEYLDSGNFDLAIVDLKLVNHDDPNDFTGIDISITHGGDTPKIIFTNFPTFEATRKALGSRIDGLPPCIDFLSKAEGNYALLTSIKKRFIKSEDFGSKNARISTDIKMDYESARKQQRTLFYIALGCGLLGLVLIFIGFMTLVKGALELAIFEGGVAIITGAISGLIYKQSRDATNRMDRYHQELRFTEQLENLLLACDEFETLEMKEKTKESVLSAAIKKSFK